VEEVPVLLLADGSRPVLFDLVEELDLEARE
jgi:hypothetical protein